MGQLISVSQAQQGSSRAFSSQFSASAYPSPTPINSPTFPKIDNQENGAQIMIGDTDDDLHVPTTPDPNSFKLQAVELNQCPDEIFDIVNKVGEGSYGSVHKALHKNSGRTLAIKMVDTMDTDLQEIIKEITIMQQCDSRHVVKYYGSYFKNSDLWIVMEYCGAGSVSDIMRLRRKTLNEAEIGAILKDTLLGLSYLHGMKKIHRDIKAGNILLNMDGNAKLADFGVAGQITDTLAKRNTVIGTPFWMAPEIIQEMGYDMKADIWSLGITAIEMAEGRPPHAEIHPMRAIFMIPTKPPPTLKAPEEWGDLFQDFIANCLVKNPEERTDAKFLLEHDFIKSAKSAKVLREMIANAQDIAAHYLLQEAQYTQAAREIDYSTMVSTGGKINSINGDEKQQLINSDTANNGLHRTDGTVGSNYDDGTLIHYGDSIRNHDAGFTIGIEQNRLLTNNLDTAVLPPSAHLNNPLGSTSNGKSESALSAGLQNVRLSSAAIGNGGGDESAGSTWDGHGSLGSAVTSAFQRAMNGKGDYSFLQDLSTEELLLRKERLEKEMESELRELRERYHAKRKAILDAIAFKKNSTVQF